ncbi:MAG: metallophosphoesterase [Clostridiales Family XIII bacterium]|jgi:predicted phosphohydrolase|nr:metallophosphoesterase [Clostridiales Family XIII bacterium]
MSIYAIGDLHLSFSADKPMDVFGEEWAGHTARLSENWRGTVKEEDTVIIAGDISWALKYQDAEADLRWIAALPGDKALIRGNHDLWWPSISRLSAFDPRMHFIQNNFFESEGVAICGGRGWILPGGDDFTAHDEKIYLREIQRLRLSLEAAEKAGFREKLVALHFPPSNERGQPTGFTGLMEEFGVRTVVYGHLHGKDVFGKGIRGNVRGTEYSLVSLDYLSCMPKKIVK